MPDNSLMGNSLTDSSLAKDQISNQENASIKQDDDAFLLEMDNINKSFPGVKALDNVNLRVRPHSIHAY